MKIKTIAETFVDNMLEDMNDSGESYCIFSLDTLDNALEDTLKDIAWKQAEKYGLSEG